MAIQITSTPENPYNEYIVTKRSIKEIYFGNKELLDNLCVHLKNNVKIYFKESWKEVQTTQKYAKNILAVDKFEDLKYELLKTIDLLLKNTDFNKHTYYINESWFNYYNLGNHQSFHNHASYTISGCFLSGVLYLESDNTSIEFTDLYSMRQNTIKIIPKQYHLLLFDSDSLHKVDPVTNEGRITLAFNVRFMG